MQKIAIADAVRHMEHEAVLCGDTLQNLMKKAGTRTAEYVLQHMPKAAQKVLVLCGKGNNGGDGYIAAQYLAEHGCTVTVLQVDGLPATELAQNAYAVVRSNSAIRFVSAEECGTDYTMVIDAVYGIGFRGALPPKTAELFAKINQWPVMRVANWP